jgi:hypothetical protein
LRENRGLTPPLAEVILRRLLRAAANALLKITGGGDATIGSQYISRQLNLGGNGTITINYTDNGTARLREVMLVE